MAHAELGPSELTEVLRASGALPEGRVTEVRVEEIGSFTNQLSRLRVGYVDAPQAPASFVLKSSAAGRRDRMGESFENEVRFYRELASGLPLRTPHFYAADVGPTGAGWLLIEDVRDALPVDWLRGPSEDHARLAVASLARMHAARWGQVDGLDWVPSFGDEDLLSSFEDAYAEGWWSRRAPLLEVVPAVADELADICDALVGHIASTHRALAEDATLLHGDAHAENMPLVRGAVRGSVHGAAGEEVVLLDWAGPRRGSAGLDLGFFIPMSFPAERRPGVERGLVALHAEVLDAGGVTPRVDPWLAYRRGVLRRLSRTVAISPHWDPSELAGLKMIFQRCAVAAVELSVGELIG
jgi:hypothetical protein